MTSPFNIKTDQPSPSSLEPTPQSPDIWQEYERADRLTCFKIVQEGFKRAIRASGQQERYISIGGYTLKLCFAGDALIPHILPALAHLMVPPTDTPALTVCLWDSTSTQTPLPLLAENWVYALEMEWTKRLDRRKGIKRYDGDRIRASFHIGPNILSLLDTQENIALYWIRDTQQMPYWEHGSPMQMLLNWWTSYNDRQYVHAGAVGTPEGGVLLAGKGGSGKSTTALACLNSDLVYASDDYCLAALEPDPYVYSLYSSAKLKGQADLERLPHLAPLVSNPDRMAEEKAMLFLHQHFPNKIVKGFPIRAVLAPHVTEESETRLVKISAVKGLKALAPSTLFQLPGAGQESFRMMAKLVKQVPCYRLELGTDIKQVPQAIAQLLEELQ